jgi:hypothetical protein
LPNCIKFNVILIFIEEATHAGKLPRNPVSNGFPEFKGVIVE